MKKQAPKQKLTVKQRTIDQLEFLIIPVSITFSKPQASQYYLYIEKGAQVLGKIDQIVNGKRSRHVFAKIHTKIFRNANDKNLTYQWSIYKCTSNFEQQYLQSISFNIKNKYVEYLQDLQKIQADLYRIYVEKEKKTEIEQIWKDLRYDLTHNDVEMQCKLVKLDANITFKLVIKCDLDHRLEKWEEQKQRKRLAKTQNGTRKGSVDSKNKNSQSSSFYESKQKINEITQSITLPIEEKVINVERLDINPIPVVAGTQIDQGLLQSQIRITNPDGVNVTQDMPDKSVYHKRVIDHSDYYYRKKSSMLSDIIEESYEGSSNVHTKSNQGEKLKSLDEIHEEEETPLFSPVIKTQAYDPEKDQEYFNRIKRTTTLEQKVFEFQLQPGSKNITKRISHNFPNVQHKNQSKYLKKQQSQIQIHTHTNSTRKSSEVIQQENQIIWDVKQAKKQTIKNVIKVFIFLVILIIVINSLNLFDQDDKKVSQERRKNYKINGKVETPNRKVKQKLK